jgi:lambda repressor-like predicted transcriptional regulator
MNRTKGIHKSGLPMSANRPPNREQGAWINYQLKRRGITQRDVGLAAKVSGPMVNRVLYGLKTSARVQRVIAASLGFDNWNELLAARGGVAA